ncbi:hypothetical protein protein, putative [Babesia ovis]|uniref:DUF1411 domain-containing protein n=1 Tax=Babesia ovis TaxID=5869 RepID=A0A9W5WWI9_BABOV|nr:hypothetical protein protein, putative [Babesia ovis]
MVGENRQNSGLFKVAKWAMGIAAVGGAISGSVMANVPHGMIEPYSSHEIKPQALKNIAIDIAPASRATWHPVHYHLDNSTMTKRLKLLLDTLTNRQENDPHYLLSQMIISALNKRGSIPFPRDYAVSFTNYHKYKTKPDDWELLKREITDFLAEFFTEELLGPRPSDYLRLRVWDRNYSDIREYVYHTVDKMPELFS